MPSSYNNDLRIEEQTTGENSGDWGTKLNASIEQIASAFSYGSEAIADASTHTITMADGTADEARSLYLKCTGGGQACTVTLAPNTVSKVWVIENATSYTLTFSQGSGANVAVLAGQVKVIATDGGGSGAVVYDALQDLAVPDLFVDDDLKLQSDSAVLSFGADGDTTLTHTDGTGLTLNSTNKICFNDASQFIQGSSATVLSLGATDEIDLTATAVDLNGTLDVSGTTTLGDTLTVNAGAVFNEASADVDFRIESNGDANCFFVNGGTDDVGIGEDTPLAKLHVKTGESSIGTLNASANTLCLEGSTHAGLTIASATNANSMIAFGDSGDADIGFINYDHNTDALMFNVNAAERMRVTSAGDVGIGCTPSATGWGSAARVLQIAGTQPLFSLKETDVTDKEFQFASSGGAIYFYDCDAAATRMLINTNGVIDGDFNDTSDISLKENIKELPSSLDVVNKLNPVSFDWKEDQRPSKGFIAQEVEAVDSTLAGGEEGSKSIKTSAIVAVLTKAVQELAEEVESLKNNKCKCEE